MKTKYVILLGLLSGLTSIFLFMSLDFYFFLNGPIRMWFTPFNVFILPIIVALLIVNILSHKFSFNEKIYSNLISGITAYIGSLLVMSIINSIILAIRP
ncbi:TetR family transcriptional regulator [Sulfurisphaera ohwakuensis]|uniref:TetR family transcriptional regulator n=1 Tax=Sulfurisphaera ohwakuensis TaxID=69656 RepID=A0A650CHW8_SULOH|nr:TetR family transcriptional regulator [Sulfurisphaera ohwakuensis]MBB5253579.1 hypothetical protein [Sulfurisphaera ohwakuensis]QGR17402.1 TetR family transcriptional regulator [Sulfurisphaera ohwakuensis]